MEGDLIGNHLAASGSSSLSYSAPIATAQQQHPGFKRGRDPSDDFALQLGQLAAPKLPTVKRPTGSLYDEAMSYTGGPMMSNNGPSRLSPTNNNETNDVFKKDVMDPSGGGDGIDGPTRVVHIRNVANIVAEMEIIQLALPFGKVTNVLLLKNKSQAFLEFADVQAAVTMVNFYNSESVQPTLGGRAVFIQHSQHKELHTSGTHSNANAQTQAAIQAAQAVAGGGSGKGEKVGNDPSPVLRVIVENMLYPITLETLLLIFKKYGPIQKIVTFTKNNTFQSLIQYETIKSAEVAKVALNGQNIYNGCCHLRVDFSKMTNLSVKFNNDKSRDFTNPSLPTGDMPVSAPGAVAGGGGPKNGPGILAPSPFSSPPGYGGPKMDAPTGPPPNFGPNMKGGFPPGPPNSLHSGGPGAGPLGRGPAGPPQPPLNPQLAALIQSLAALSGNPQQAALLTSLGLGGLPSGNAGGNNPAAAAAQATLLARLAGLQGNPMAGIGAAAAAAGPGAATGGSGSVLLVSNLPEGSLTPEDLFTLFGVYGDVVRVKILYNKKDNALIQMADATQALQATQFLDKIKLYGKPIRVTASKHTTVQMPKEGAPDGGLTKDFSNSPLHRFKKPGSKNYSNVFAPSATLHLSNIPPNTSEETLVDAFKEFGAVNAFKFFPKDHKMALIGLDSVEEAVVALIKMHNYQLAESSHLRVSFSKSNIQM